MLSLPIASLQNACARSAASDDGSLLCCTVIWALPLPSPASQVLRDLQRKLVYGRLQCWLWPFLGANVFVVRSVRQSRMVPRIIVAKHTGTTLVLQVEAVATPQLAAA
ncbi:MAG: hypothetical protein HY680_00800 [Chloroflexi bacterium]|nr:hypothetical protein [Chloroflexota bacterium]